jgi:ubiquinone biosynthesis monooxygenase Coq7
MPMQRWGQGSGWAERSHQTILPHGDDKTVALKRIFNPTAIYFFVVAGGERCDNRQIGLWLKTSNTKSYKGILNMALQAFSSNADAKADLASMLRVNHAGEYGAVRIYAGQQRFVKSPQAQQLVAEMAAQEAVHLEQFRALMAARQVRPSVLLPLWHLLGYGLGAATALLGDAAAMACTEAVETVIDQHYAEQLAALPPDEADLASTLRQFQAEEVEHKNQAVAAGAQNAVAYPILTGLIKTGSRLAIELSKRF